MTEDGLTAREVVTKLARVALRSFLDTGGVLRWTPVRSPRVSVVMLLCNRAELTLASLRSLVSTGIDVPLELILVDNGSSDETRLLLARIDGARVIRNLHNVGYPRGVNQGARRAAGEFVLLLNNDTQLLGDSIGAAVSVLDANPDVGAVGGRLIHPDGMLQEAGCSVMADGWPVAQGRGRPPDDPAVGFQRDVDYCSGAFLLTRRALFRQLGGLDERFSPCYFEDVDYCMRLWAAGWRVVYHPDIAVLHHENATSHARLDLTALAERNHALFVGKHSAWLPQRLPRADWAVVAGRAALDMAPRILVVADGFFAGSRAPATAPDTLAALVRRLLAIDAFLTVCYTTAVGDAILPALEALPRTVEMYPCESPAHIARLVQERRSYYALIIPGDAAARPFVFDRHAGGAAQAVWAQGRLSLLPPEGDIARTAASCFNHPIC
jgi:GT2 family glycosyltransferase